MNVLCTFISVFTLLSINIASVNAQNQLLELQIGFDSKVIINGVKFDHGYINLRELCAITNSTKCVVKRRKKPKIRYSALVLGNGEIEYISDGFKKVGDNCREIVLKYNNEEIENLISRKVKFFDVEVNSKTSFDDLYSNPNIYSHARKDIYADAEDPAKGILILNLPSKIITFYFSPFGEILNRIYIELYDYNPKHEQKRERKT